MTTSLFMEDESGRTIQVWREPSSIPKTGALILIVMYDFTVYACRFGLCDDDTEAWFEPDWHGVTMSADDAHFDKIAGWLPFPALRDPWPNGPIPKSPPPTPGEG